jgi:hypothetical protein
MVRNEKRTCQQPTHDEARTSNEVKKKRKNSNQSIEAILMIASAGDTDQRRRNGRNDRMTLATEEKKRYLFIFSQSSESSRVDFIHLL